MYVSSNKDLSAPDTLSLYETINNIINNHEIHTISSDLPIIFESSLSREDFADKYLMVQEQDEEHQYVLIENFSVHSDFDMSYVDSVRDEDVGRHQLMEKPITNWEEYFSTQIWLDQIVDVLTDRLALSDELRKCIIIPSISIDPSPNEYSLVNLKLSISIQVL